MNGETYTSDAIRAVDAKFEAQKICFAPLAFQAVRALLELGVLRAVSDAGDTGLTREEAAAKTGLSVYGAGVLMEMALGLGLMKLRPNEQPERFVLGKTGWFFLEDDMTSVNFNFVNDICYQGAFRLGESVKEGKPRGLEVFGNRWATIYEALASLPERARKSWFAFDHFYSDIAFPEALPVVFETKPSRIFDIGGNTAKWAIACCAYDSRVRVTIIDLPGQTAEAEKNAAAAGFSNRIDTVSRNVLDETVPLPPLSGTVWMSQFLDCFSLEDISRIAARIRSAALADTEICVLEPLWDKQRFEASAYSLQATSLYFTCMANGGSKMYRNEELVHAVESGGLELKSARHDLGANNYSLLRFRPRP